MTLPLIGLTTVPYAGEDGRIRDGMLPTYSNAVIEAGGVPVLIPLNVFEGDDDRLLRTIYERVDGLLIPGGGDVHPAEYGESLDDTITRINRLRDKVELQLVRWAYAEDRPLLGICRGQQVMNVALGGTLLHDIPAALNGTALQHDQDGVLPRDHIVHDVAIAPDSRLAEILGTASVPVNSLHHQAVRTLAPSLTASAQAKDGIIEAIEVPGAYFFLGVQWHPEYLTYMPEMRRLFERFIEACAERARTSVP